MFHSVFRIVKTLSVLGALSLVWACNSSSGGSSSLGQFSKLAAPLTLNQLKTLVEKESYAQMSGANSAFDSFDVFDSFQPSPQQLEKIMQLAEVLKEINEVLDEGDYEDCDVELLPAEKLFVVDGDAISLNRAPGQIVAFDFPDCGRGSFEIRRNSDSEFWVTGLFESKEAELLKLAGKSVKVSIEAYAKTDSNPSET